MEINYLKLYPNLERIFHLTNVFYCTVKLVSPDPKMQPQLNAIYSALGWDIPEADDHTDMVIEIPKSSYDQILKASTPEPGDETVYSIKGKRKARIAEFGMIEEEELPLLKLAGTSGEKLLRVAVDRYGMTPIQMESIMDVSRIIAYHDKSDKVEDYHLAEAIMYQSYDPEDYK